MPAMFNAVVNLIYVALHSGKKEASDSLCLHSAGFYLCLILIVLCVHYNVKNLSVVFVVLCGSRLSTEIKMTQCNHLLGKNINICTIH